MPSTESDERDDELQRVFEATPFFKSMDELAAYRAALVARLVLAPAVA